MAAYVRYIVTNVSDSIVFYTKLLGFQLEMHPAPPFAEVSLGDLHLYLTEAQRGPGGGAAMPSGEQQAPGGWNRIHLVVDDLDAQVSRLSAAGASFRNQVMQGVGGKQILVADPSGNLVELFQPNTSEYRAPGSGNTSNANR
ncbi:MAG: VOC family protein [Acidobacteriaceae bacterium]